MTTGLALGFLRGQVSRPPDWLGSGGLFGAAFGQLMPLVGGSVRACPLQRDHQGTP